MKGSMLWKLMYLFCALAGILAGYGIFTLAGAEEIEPNTITKDNTLVRESDDSVFFDGIKEEPVMPTVTSSPTPVETAEEVTMLLPEVPLGNGEDILMPEVTQNLQSELVSDKSLEPSKDKKMEEVVTGQAVVTVPPEEMPSLASQWAVNRPGAIPTPLPIDVVLAAPQNETAEVITYPAEIFGQVPVINRSDETVSYFEFSYDLINMLEPIVKQRGLKLSTLLTKFVIKALLYGVDIEELNINAPIPRRQAALTLWLAAQLLGEPGSDTSAKSAGMYVTDIAGCSSPERKAVAYLYERGILKGYQVNGQKFYPDAALKTESGNKWLSGIKQCWK